MRYRLSAYSLARQSKAAKVDNLGCASGRTTFRKHPARHRARRSAWPPERWDPLLVRNGMLHSSPCKVDNLGCASGRTTFRKHPARHRARRSAGSPRTRHVRDHLLELRPEERHAHVRGARGFVRVRLYFDSRSAGSMPCEDAACVASSAAGVLREHISRFIIPSRFLISRCSLRYLVSSWLISQFCVSDYKVKWEFIITIPDSSFTLRALACVRWSGLGN